MEPEQKQPFFGTWIRPMGLRGSLAAGFGRGSSAYGEQSDSTDSSAEWGAQLAGSLAFLDRRVFSLDYSAGIQDFGAGTAAPSTDSRNSTLATNVGLSANVLAGRSMPFRVIFNRVSTGYDAGVSIDGSPESVQNSTGTHTSLGAAWDLNIPNLPVLHASATKDSDSQVRNYLFGQSQWTTQRQAELRATDNREKLAYDASYNYLDFGLEIPEARLETRTTQHLLGGTVRWEPTPKWQINLDGRSNRYQLGRNYRGGEASGFGATGAVRFAPADRFFTSIRYGFSTNLAEALLSGEVGSSQSGLVGEGGLSLQQRMSTGDFEARAGYVRQAGSVELFARSFSVGAPLLGALTLAERRTVGATLQGQRQMAGMEVSGSFEGEFGTAESGTGVSEPYEAGFGQLSLSRQAGRALRFSIDGSLRLSSRLTFYMMPLDGRSGGARIETLLPAWARLTAAARWSSARRDGLYNDYNDRFASWSVAIAGPRYGVAFDVNSGDAQSQLLSPDLLKRRLDLAILLDRQPDLIGAYMASAVRSRQLSARLEPWRSLQVRAFAQREERHSYGLYDQSFEMAQVSLVYSLRQVQIEAGWNGYTSSTSLDPWKYGNSRFFVRIRREISIF